MGSDSSSLRGFTLQDPPWTQPSGLTIYPALLPEGRPASVFVYQPGNQEKVDKAARHLKTLRHPCLLRFLSCTVEEDGIYLVTERVQPLEMLLEKLSTDEICAGIYDILQALVFLHDRGKVSHNNVCLSSVFVSEDGHWKLGGMEMVCNLTEVTPESAEFGIHTISLSHARDAFSFGRLVENLLAHVEGETDALSNFKSTIMNSLLNPEPDLRPPLSNLLLHNFFKNDFLEVVNFLESLTVKAEEEKNEFFKFLLDRVSSLSEELISSRLVPLLLNQLVFAEPVAVKSFLPYLLRPKRDIMGRTRENCLLSPALFQTRVIPVLMKMFEVHEEHVRVVLLTHIDAYGELFTLKELKDIILPQVLLGLRDTSDMLVSVTLRGLAALVCLLGPETVVGGGRVKIFKSTTPGFTKTSDITPDDSPEHSADKQQMLNQESILAKSSLPGTQSANQNCLFHKELKLKYSPKKLSNDNNSPLNSSFNGIFMSKKTVVDSHFVNNQQEEWPDWSEQEPLSSEQAVDTAVKSLEDDHGLQNFETWGDFGLSSDSSITVDSNSTINHRCDIGGNIQNTSLNSSLHLKTTANGCVADAPNQTKRPNSSVAYSKVPFETDIAKKSVLQYGLGEEFTIKVKSTNRDPELDLFADMAPDIQLSSFVFNTTSGGTEKTLEHSKDPNPDLPNYMNAATSQGTAFSSKFAPAEITEVEGEGWGEENDFSWEEDVYNIKL
ncbi:hypothetical protein GDO86_007552 [Hymenochirus boettgeri]|uniref:Protein kinase domain-containing protein n=1 Tax=Hymenochirus boettgeri TaxID=247094 RepID=A0A8T2IU82_9PIPI|nr:hypothetical protein GDO86_007552 [Hymenochirus boettgeri]